MLVLSSDSLMILISITNQKLIFSDEISNIIFSLLKTFSNENTALLNTFHLVVTYNDKVGIRSYRLNIWQTIDCDIAEPFEGRKPIDWKLIILLPNLPHNNNFDYCNIIWHAYLVDRCENDISKCQIGGNYLYVVA